PGRNRPPCPAFHPAKDGRKPDQKLQWVFFAPSPPAKYFARSKVGRWTNPRSPRKPNADLQQPPPTTHPKRSRTLDRKSTRLNSSHVAISYAVFCLKKKTTNKHLT